MFHKVYILWQHCARNGGIFNNHFTANLRRNNPAIKIENPIRFNRTMAMNLGVSFLPTLYIRTSTLKIDKVYTVGYSVLINRRFIHILSPVTKRWQTMLLLNCLSTSLNGQCNFEWGFQVSSWLPANIVARITILSNLLSAFIVRFVRSLVGLRRPARHRRIIGKGTSMCYIVIVATARIAAAWSPCCTQLVASSGGRVHCQVQSPKSAPSRCGSGPCLMHCR